MFSLIMPHRNQGGMERFISHIIRLSGDIRGKKLVWDITVVKGWGWGEGSHTQPKLEWLELPASVKGGSNPDFLIACPDMKERVKGRG